MSRGLQIRHARGAFPDSMVPFLGTGGDGAVAAVTERGARRWRSLTAYQREKQAHEHGVAVEILIVVEAMSWVRRGRLATVTAMAQWWSSTAVSYGEEGGLGW